MESRTFWAELAEKGERVFCEPAVLYSWEEIIEGAPVRRPDGTIETMRAVAFNTFRGHTRIDKSRPGSSEVFPPYFLTNRDRLLSGLEQVRDREDLHRLLNEVCEDIRSRMTNIVDSVRASFNSVRKPVDLYVEHLVAMAREVSPEVRRRLVPLLFLPLDSVMLGPIEIPGQPLLHLFDPATLARYRLSRRSSYGHIRSETAYKALQAEVDAKCRELSDRCGRPFHPVYLDLLWGERYLHTGQNLFELNPPIHKGRGPKGGRC